MAVATADSGARARRARPEGGVRVIRIGVLGLGSVGQAVVRTVAASAAPLRRRGFAIAIDCALVRDVAKPRRCPRVARVTNNVEAFMRGRYDAVIDALAGAEPAGAIAGRLLGKGIPVVSANKALIALEGPRLRAIAARAGTSLRIEASAIAGVPFLGALERRPLAASATHFTGIVNGTSHFILSRVAEGATFAAALAEAQALGYAEPDPAADIDGTDAVQKLVVLAAVLFDRVAQPSAIPVESIAHIGPEDLAAARALGGAIKPIVIAARRPDAALAAFAGPAWVPSSHPLMAVSGRDNIIAIDTRFSGRLIFAGPGAGPDVTAATLLDDAIEAASEAGADMLRAATGAGAPVPSAIHAPETAWFVRANGTASAAALARAVSIQKQTLEGNAVWALTARTSAEQIASTMAAIRADGGDVRAWRAIVD